MVNGSNLLRKTKLKDEITKLKADKLKGAMLDPGDILQKYIDIAFSDITDYVEFGQEEVPVMGAFGPIKIKDEYGEETELTKIVNVIKFKESSNIDGTIISEVKQGKDGASIKLQDKMKALDWLANHTDLLDTATKQKLELENKKFELEKSKVNNGGGEADKSGIEEFIKATTMSEQDISELFKDDEEDE
jgi:phage terminase small subunit